MKLKEGPQKEWLSLLWYRRKSFPEERLIGAEDACSAERLFSFIRVSPREEIIQPKEAMGKEFVGLSVILNGSYHFMSQVDGGEAVLELRDMATGELLKNVQFPDMRNIYGRSNDGCLVVFAKRNRKRGTKIEVYQIEGGRAKCQQM